MMDCKHLREILDCYVDDELSADGSADAAAHLRECAACARAASELASLRLQVRQAVMIDVPPDLEQRIRRSLRPWSDLRPPASGRAAAMVAAAAALLAVVVWIVSPPGAVARDATAAALDRAVVQLAEPRAIVLEGVVLCRDCELEKRFGIPAPCRTTGHHGAIATSDGRIWNIIDHSSARALIHDDSLHGKTVRVRARMLRPAGTIAVDGYEILG